MSRAIRASALLGVLVVVAVACGDAAEDTTTTTGTPEPSGPVFDITVEGFAFTPADATVEVGTTVRWTNRDALRHTATADDGAFDGSLSATPFEFTMTTPGVYDYHCAIHPEMRASITVEG